MSVINVTTFRKNLYRLIAEVNDNSEPITIVNNNGKNAVLLSEDDWKAIQETNYINSIQGLAKNIIENSKVPLEESLQENEVPW
ncbi:MAG: type II toxin-antitoxin system Phd/YefM family antitoxin [Mobilitalea sp.]